MKGNLVNWDTASLSLTNMEHRDEPMSTLCVPTRPGHVLFPDKRNFSAMIDLCEMFHGTASVITDKETQDELFSMFKKEPNCGGPEVGKCF